MKEAVIKFSADSAASTACLLNNALVDGANIKVNMLPQEDEKSNRTPSPSSSQATATNDSFTSIFSGLASSSMAFASTVATKVKALDQQYGVSDTVIAGANTAWQQSKKLASDIDTKYNVKESIASAVQTTKEKVSSAAGGKAGTFSTGSPRVSPTGSPPPPRSASPYQKQ